MNNLQFGIEYIEPFILVVPKTLKTTEELHSIDIRGLIWSIESNDDNHILTFKSHYDTSIYNRLIEESVHV